MSSTSPRDESLELDDGGDEQQHNSAALIWQQIEVAAVEDPTSSEGESQEEGNGEGDEARLPFKLAGRGRGSARLSGSTRSRGRGSSGRGGSSRSPGGGHSGGSTRSAQRHRDDDDDTGSLSEASEFSHGSLSVASSARYRSENSWALDVEQELQAGEQQPCSSSNDWAFRGSAGEGEEGDSFAPVDDLDMLSDAEALQAKLVDDLERRRRASAACGAGGGAMQETQSDAPWASWADISAPTTPRRPASKTIMSL